MAVLVSSRQDEILDYYLYNNIHAASHYRIIFTINDDREYMYVYARTILSKCGEAKLKVTHHKKLSAQLRARVYEIFIYV